jgi:hypothetical protein
MDLIISAGAFARGRALGGPRVKSDEEIGALPLNTPVITDPAKTILLDVSIADAQADVHMNHRSSSTQLTGAANRHSEDHKRRHYLGTFPSGDNTLRAGALEAQGGFGKEFVSVLELMATHATGGEGANEWRRAGYLRRMKQQLSATLQQSISNRVVNFRNALAPAAEYALCLEAADF